MQYSNAGDIDGTVTQYNNVGDGTVPAGYFCITINSCTDT